MKRTYLLILCMCIGFATNDVFAENIRKHEFNGVYEGPYLNRIAFPLGGIGAGMVCLEGNGSFIRSIHPQPHGIF